jgi:hypothetical protein
VRADPATGKPHEAGPDTHWKDLLGLFAIIVPAARVLDTVIAAAPMPDALTLPVLRFLNAVCR